MRVLLPTSPRRARIEIIPLIDIMFFLLATFIMVSLSITRNQSLPVKLPMASSAAPQNRTDFISIIVDEEGHYFVDKEPIANANLEPRLEALKASQQDPKIMISGDSRTAFAHVVTLLDEIRKVGIGKVAIETQKPTDTPSGP